jgi:hypothetical protein
LLIDLVGGFFMHPTPTSSASGFRSVLMFGRAISVGVFIFAIVASAQEQTPTPNSGVSAKQPHWHKYVNRKYGFSFWYPDPYRPVPVPPLDPEVAKYHQFEKDLLFLQRRDNPDAKIWIIVDVRPFDVHTMGQYHSPTGYDPSWVPEGHPIGRHVFYFYGAGGGGVDYWDQRLVELKGKTLGFYFDGPYDAGKSPNADTQQLEPRILKTFRTF